MTLHQDSSPSNAPAASNLGRVVAALLTPCSATGEVDPSGMRMLAEKLTQHGCDGLFALSSTGEMVLLDEDDRRRLTQAARDGAGPGTTLFVGVGGTGPRQAVRLAKLAESDGADVAVVMAPFFQTLSQWELLSSTLEIADQSPIPIAVYHHVRMQTPFAVETVARLAEHPNIIACKDTSVDFERMQKLIQVSAGQNFVLYQGSEHLIRDSLRCGTHGCISALACLAPEWHADLIAAVLQQDAEKAQLAHDRIVDLIRLFLLPEVKLSLAHFVHVLKYSSWRRGWIPSTASLLSGFEATPEFNAAIAAILEETGIAPARVSAES